MSYSHADFNLDLDNFPTFRALAVWLALNFHSRLKVSFSLETFNPGGKTWKFSIFRSSAKPTTFSTVLTVKPLSTPFWTFWAPPLRELISDSFCHFGPFEWSLFRQVPGSTRSMRAPSCELSRSLAQFGEVWREPPWHSSELQRKSPIFTGVPVKVPSVWGWPSEYAQPVVGKSVRKSRVRSNLWGAGLCLSPPYTPTLVCGVAACSSSWARWQVRFIPANMVAHDQFGSATVWACPNGSSGSIFGSDGSSGNIGLLCFSTPPLQKYYWQIFVCGINFVGITGKIGNMVTRNHFWGINFHGITGKFAPVSAQCEAMWIGDKQGLPEIFLMRFQEKFLENQFGAITGNSVIGNLWLPEKSLTNQFGNHFSRARKPWSANCELKHWNSQGWKCLIHSLHFTV